MTFEETLQRDLTVVGRGIVIVEHKSCPSVQLGVTIVNGRIDEKELISRLNDVLAKPEWFRFRCSVQPKFRQTPLQPETKSHAEEDEGSYVFVPIKNFDAREVVSVDKWVPEVEEQLDRHEWIEKYLSHLQSKKILRPGPQPFWRVHLGYTPDGSQSVFSLRIHHCLADGFTAGTFLADLIDNIDPRDQLETYANLYQKKMSKLQSGWRKVFAVVLYFLWIMWGLVVICVKSLRLMGTPRPPELLSRPVTSKKVVGFDSTSISLEEVHALRKKIGVTVNDFYLALVSCTVRNVLKKYSQVSTLPQRDFPHIPKYLPLGIPVDLRPMMGRFNYFGNYIGMMSLYAPLDTNLSFVGILHDVKRQMDFNKKIPESVLLYNLNKLFEWLPLWMGQLVYELGTTRFAFGFSNVRAYSGENLSLCGCPIDNICPFMPPPYPINLGFCLCTWNDQCVFTVNVDENMLGEDGARIVLGAYRQALTLARHELSDEVLHD